MEYQYQLRPHHGMCMAFFQGKGYSSEFTAHMGEIIHSLGNNPVIRISAHTDVICAKCPNNQMGICDAESKVMEYDRQVLEKCGLREGDTMPYAEFRRVVDTYILRPGKRKDICGNCQWSELCAKTEEKQCIEF